MSHEMEEHQSSQHGHEVIREIDENPTMTIDGDEICEEEAAAAEEYAQENTHDQTP